MYIWLAEVLDSKGVAYWLYYLLTYLSHQQMKVSVSHVHIESCAQVHKLNNRFVSSEEKGKHINKNSKT